MNKARKFIFIGVLFISAVLIFSKKVSALTPILSTELNNVDMKVLSCTVLKSGLDKKISNFNESKGKHIETYTKMVDRLSQMIEKWNEWGYDTDEVEDDLEVMEDKINEYKTDYATLITKITEAKNACGTSDYSLKLTKAKEALKEVRKDVVNIRVFYQTELRKDIVKMKGQELN